MHKIINWTFGSFFRTMGRFIFYIIIGSLLMYLLKDLKIGGLFNILEVHADTTTDAWVLNMNQIERGSYYNWTGASTLGSSIALTSDNFIVEWFDNHNESVLINLNYMYNTNAINVGSNGISIGGNAAQVFVSGYLYRVVLYVCGTQNFSRYSSSSFVIGNNANDVPTQSWIQLQGINVPSSIKSNINTNINYCYAINGVVAPSSNGYNMFARITGTSNTKLYLFGYNFDVLGNISNLTSQEVQNIIDNSGLATASSITQVQSSVNQVRQDLNEVNSSIETQTEQQHEDHQETIDTITDTSSPNLDSLNNSAGWLPAGPVDSILNLPLSLLNNLTLNLSKNCSAVELPLPYINQNIQLPCLNTIYNQIDGVSSWINTIGTIASAFILFGYLINLYKYIDDTLTFRENNYIDNWSGV